jgi:hypothetical protein
LGQILVPRLFFHSSRPLQPAVNSFAQPRPFIESKLNGSLLGLFQPTISFGGALTSNHIEIEDELGEYLCPRSITGRPCWNWTTDNNFIS